MPLKEKTLGNRLDKAKKTKAETIPETMITKREKGKKVPKKFNQEKVDLPKTLFHTIATALEVFASKSTEKQRDKLTNNEIFQKAIAEIESIGSSSETDDVQEIMEEEEEKDLFVKTDLEDLLEFGKFSVEELSSDEELNKSQKDLVVFDMFEDVLDIDEISLALTEDLMDKHPNTVDIDPTISTDTGKFVNPLTGVRSSSSTTQSTTSKEDIMHQSIEESELEEIENEDGISLDSDMSKADLIKTSDDFDKVPVSIKSNDDILQQFFEKEKEMEANVPDEYNAAKVFLLHEEQERLNLQHTLDFLNKLIDHCVTKAEYKEDIILRKSLDKMKLMKNLKVIHDLLEVERRGMRFLNRKCVEHFKRKSSFRLISADDPKTIKNDIKNFSNALDLLDKCLITEEKTKSQCSFQVLEMRKQFKEFQQRSIKEVDQLEQLIKSTFQSKNYKLQTLVQNSLNRMSVIRKEISEVRFRLLIKQHNVSELRQQRKKLEDLGNCFKLTQYETMETETNVLGKKVEERNSNLKKLHKQYNSDLHSIAHLKEKQNILRHIVNIQKQYFKQLQQHKETYRSFNTELKLKRKKLRTDIRNLSFQSGLLDKPVLMRDYDETVETANKLRGTIEDLKDSIGALTNQIAELEKI